MLVDRTPAERIHLPWDESEWIEFRKVSWKELKASSRAQDSEQREDMQDLGADFAAAFSGQRTPEERAEIIEAMRERRYDAENFDTELLLVASISDWSAEDESGDPVPVNAESISKLDEGTAVWAKEQAIRITRPIMEVATTTN